MRKAIILALIMVMALGAGALAADVKVGGEVRYLVNVPSDVAGAPGPSDGTQYRLKVSATLSDLTSALIYLKSGKADGAFDAVLNAEFLTKFPGFGTLAVGNSPDFGTSPFVKYGTVWGGMGDDPYGVSFASETFGGVAGQVFLAPGGTDAAFGAGELTYALPMLEGSSVGLAFCKMGAKDEADLALIANLPFNEMFTLYGEAGQSAGSDELDVQTLGASVKAGAVTVYGETELKNEKYYLQATYPVHSVSLNAGYQFGDGYTTAGDNGKLTLWAKVSF